MACDLHTHSIFSDGTETPAELIAQAEALGLGALALCDHNTVDGLPDFLAAADESPVQAVPGIEFSTDYAGTELHILALFVQPRYFPAVDRLVEEPMRRKEASNRQMVDRLCRAGFVIDYEAIKASTPGGSVNLAHIAAALMEKGYVNSTKVAFDTFLQPNGKYYTPPQRLTAFEVITFIRSINAVSVLAHPFLNLEEAPLRQFLDQAVPLGLDGMEVFYSEYDAARTELSLKISGDYGLLPGGGSDYHGSKKSGIAMGTGRGSLAVPDDCYETLAALAAQRQKNEVET